MCGDISWVNYFISEAVNECGSESDDHICKEYEVDDVI